MPRDWQLNQETGHYWAYDNLGRCFARVGNVEMTWAQYLANYPPRNPAGQPQHTGVPRVLPSTDLRDHDPQRALAAGEGPSNYGHHQGTAAVGHRRNQLPRRYSLASGSGSAKELDSKYVKKPPGFFVRYRVLLIYWHENAGDENGTSLHVTHDQRHGERIFSKFRRLIVIAVFERHCIAAPIQTYKQKGVSKAGVNPSDHAIVYTKINRGPSTLEVRQGVDKAMQPAIEVVPDDPAELLDPYSRLNYSELYTVQFNAKVKALGMLHPRSRPVFDESSSAVLRFRMFPPPMQQMTERMQQLRTLRASQAESSTQAQTQRGADTEDDEDDAEDESGEDESGEDDSVEEGSGEEESGDEEGDDE